MKKLSVILCAAIVALSALSCGKDVKPAAPMAPNAIQQKLADVAVSAIKEVDPDNWKDWGQTCLKLVEAVSNVEEGNIEEFSDMLEDLLVSVKEKDNYRTVTNVIRLSAFTGNITVENNALKYTPGSNLLCITYNFNGKTYKAQLESAGESGDGIIVAESSNTYQSSTVSVVVPQTAAIHVTENGSLFLDLVVNPVVTDANKDGKLGEEDTIQGSATLQIPGYAFYLQDLSLSADGGTAKVNLQHGSTSVVSIDGKVEIDIRATTNEDYSSLIREVDDIEGNISLMGGAAILKATVDVQDIRNLGNMTVSSEADAKKLADAVNKSLKAELYFDNNPTVQATLCTAPYQADQYWTLMPVIRFSDGSADMLLADFFDSTLDVYKPLAGELNAFTKKIEKYFPELMSNSQDK